MDKNLTIKERILLYAENKGISKSEIFEKMGIAASNFKGVGLKSEMSGDKIVKFLTIYSEVSSDWLLTGVGDMLKQEHQVQLAHHSVDPHKGIPLIPIEAMAGFGNGETQVLEYECERYIIPAFSDAEFLIQVKGSSMYPKYNSGDIVACKKLPLSNLFFQWNKVYVLDTVQGALIKRIKKGTQSDHILIVSDNEKYEPFELHINQIHSISIVIGVIRLE